MMETKQAEIERLNYLIRILAGNNARVFAEKAGIRPDCLSRARLGKRNPSAYFERILAAYPDVSRDWLYYGTGEPLVSVQKAKKEKGEILDKLDHLEREIKRLAELVEWMAEYQKSTN